MCKIGATGNYPDGQISSDDGGELAVGLRIHKNNLIIGFGKDISWIGLGKEEALQLANMIIIKAGEIK